MNFMDACLLAGLYFASKKQMGYFWAALALGWVDMLIGVIFRLLEAA